MDYSRYQRIRVTHDQRIVTLTLNRPEVMNAVDQLMHDELVTLFDDVQRDAAADVVVLTGAGQAFCGGGDLDWLESTSRDRGWGPSSIDGKRIIASLLELEKPIIARIPGPCVGLGATLALFCDIIYAAESAKIGDPHVRVGIVAGDGGAAVWPALVGFARAKEYLMTGDLMSAAEAERIGLINHVVPDADLDAAVYAMAARLARGPLLAIRWTKVATNIELRRLTHAAMESSVPYEMLTFASEDHREALAALKDKRKPVFKGR